MSNYYPIDSNLVLSETNKLTTTDLTVTGNFIYQGVLETVYGNTGATGPTGATGAQYDQSLNMADSVSFADILTNDITTGAITQIDANGELSINMQTGKMRIYNGAVQTLKIDTSDDTSNWISLNAGSVGSNNRVILGTYGGSGEERAIVAGHNAGLTGYQPLYLNYGEAPCIFGNTGSTGYVADSALLAVYGKSVFDGEMVVNDTVTCSTDLYRDLTGIYEYGYSAGSNSIFIAKPTTSSWTVVRAAYLIEVTGYTGTTGEIRLSLYDGVTELDYAIISADSAKYLQPFCLNKPYDPNLEFFELRLAYTGDQTGSITSYSYVITIQK